MKRKYEGLTDHVSLPIKTVDANVRMFLERQRKNAALAREAQNAYGLPQCQRHRRWYQQGKNFKLTHYRMSRRESGERSWIGCWQDDSRDARDGGYRAVEPMADKRIILFIYLFYIGGLTFLLSISRDLCLCMVSYMASRKITAMNHDRS